MNWVLFIWLVWDLNSLCEGQLPKTEDYRLSPFGYHLCTRNESRLVSYTVQYVAPYTVTRLCGGWIPWKTCQVTKYRMTQYTEYKTVTEQVIRCCDGYVQVGQYCAPTVDRSRETTVKPGSCPATVQPWFHGCDWDIDCPGWQKCCQFCTDPTSSSYSDRRESQFNATVTIKVDYHELMSREGGLYDHTRLLYAMVTGVLESNVSIYYLSSQPVHPYRTATSLMIDFKLSPSLYNVTSVLHGLIKHIQEVSSVTVEDIDECAQPFLHRCSPHAACVNTVGSHFCTCRPGFADVDPTNTGINCTAMSTPPPKITCFPPIAPAPGNTSTTEPPASVSPSLNVTTETFQPPSTCSAPSVTNVRVANVTGTSFSVHWSSQFQGNQSYRVVLSKGSEVVYLNDTSQTVIEIRGVQAGVLYEVIITPYACGRRGNSVRLTVKTDAQTLDATARLTNVEYTSELQNTSSTAYTNLTASIYMEIYQSLSPEMKALVDSGQVRIEITGFAPGSVVASFSLIFTVSQSGDTISNVSSAVLNSLMNSSKYDVDKNNTQITDRDECASQDNDCSPFALCINTWGSYSCSCFESFVDENPERPGRSCEAITDQTSSMATTAADTRTSALTATSAVYGTSTTTTTASTTTTVAPTTTANAPTSSTVPTSIISSPTTATVAQITTSSALIVTSLTPTTTTTVPTTITVALIATTASTTTIVAPTTTTAAPTTTTTTSAPTTTTAAPTTTTSAPTTTTAAPTTTTAAPTTTTAAPTTTTTAPTTTTSAAPTTTTAAPTTTTVAPTTTTSAAPTTTTAAPTTTTAAPTITAAAPTTTTTAPTTTTTAAPTTTTSAAPTTTTAAPTTTTTAASTTSPTAPTTTTITGTTTTTSAPTTTTITGTTTTTSASTTTTITGTIITTAGPTTLRTANISASEAIAVTCNMASLTVTVARDFLQSSQISEAALYLGRADCGVNGGNSTHAQLTVAWDECNTLQMHNDSYFTVSVTLFNSISSVQVPKIRLQIPVICSYMKNMLITSDFGSMGYDMIKDVIAGSGMFQVSVQLMNGSVPLPHNYSLSPSEAVLLVVSLNTSVDRIKVVINKCWATASPSPTLVSSYVFMDNRCSMNRYTTVITNGNSSISSLSVQIFSFVDLSVIYLHCQVEICVEMSLGSCAPNCVQKTYRFGAANSLGTAVGTSGPLLRQDSGSDPFDEGYDKISIIGLSCLGVGLAVFFIIGFVCLFYYQRNRIGHYNFHSKPKEENFTVLTLST